MANKLWAGRFSSNTNELVEAFTSSIEIDKRLYIVDILGSIAHCQMLAKQNIISQNDAKAICDGLEEIKQEIKNNNFEFKDSLEDIHMHIESRLIDLIGDVAKKLHTARSRNDQVATDIRLYLKDEVNQILFLFIDLNNVLIDLSKKNIDVIMPGYTHLQRAQPILFSHYLMAYFQMFKRDIDRFHDCLNRIDILPLGSAALAGTSYPLDRQFVAKKLGFNKISENSIDSVSDRDFIIEFLSNASISMVHFSRLSEELILWSSSEFNFIEISDSFTTGSSIMPQKKNPDVCELVRGKSSSVFGNLISILTLMKSLPLSYNRDMQEDKKPLFETIDTLKACIKIYTDMLPEIKINKNIMEDCTSKGFLNATDAADYLVSKGMPFRDAHKCIGKLVKFAQEKNNELQDLTLDEFKKFSLLFKDDIYKFLSTKNIVNRKTSYGGTAKENVMLQIKNAELII